MRAAFRLVLGLIFLIPAVAEAEDVGVLIEVGARP